MNNTNTPQTMNYLTNRKNINGICYILDEENKTASVCSLDDEAFYMDDVEHYEGYVQIPSTITYTERYCVCSIEKKRSEERR